MQVYCLPLELIAFAIHPGDTQSTTTVCVEVSIRCLYLTSQSNSDFAGVTVETIHGIIDFLATASSNYQRGVWDLKKCKEEFWLNHCALADKQNATGSLAVRKKIDEIYNKLYHQLWKKFLLKSYGSATLSTLKGMIREIIVINDENISYHGSIDRTGVHGESRILRFLFIRDYPTIHLARTGTFFYLLPSQPLDKDTQDNARTWFKEKISVEQLAMGSSQGTCLGCCNCLDEFSIARGDSGNKPGQWLDPITFRGTQGTTEINTSSDRLHAIFVAYKYIIV